MKTRILTLPLLSITATFFVGCTTTTQTTQQPPEQIHGVSQTYTQHDLQRSGRANTGPALRTIDPDVE